MTDCVPDWTALVAAVEIDPPATYEEVRQAWIYLACRATSHADRRILFWVISRFPPDGSPPIPYDRLGKTRQMSGPGARYVVLATLLRLAQQVRHIRSRATFAELEARPAPEQPLEWLDLDLRSYNVLHREGCRKIGDVTRFSEAELLALRHFGQKSLRVVRDRLQQHGLTLSGEGE